MLRDIGTEKNKQFIVGYDLGEKYSQISYCTKQQSVPETLPVVVGTELYNVPTVLCKRKEMNQWYYGKEAVKRAKNGEGYLVDHLVSRACNGEQIEIEGRVYDAGALLTIFVKRSFGIFFHLSSLTSIETLVITAEELSGAMIKVLDQIIDGLELKTKKIFFQTYAESYYYYMMGQDEDFRRGTSVLFDYHVIPEYQDGVTDRTSPVKVYQLDINKNTTPYVGMITEDFENTVIVRVEDETGQIQNEQEMDQQLRDLMQRELGGKLINTAYLIGDGFEGTWMKDALQYLCMGGRRVFQGNNLYSKGAAYAAYEKTYPGMVTQNYVFLGEDKLKSNIGMQIGRQGEDSYLAILDAGVNWYDARAEYEMYLEEDNSIVINVSPLSAVMPNGTASYADMMTEEKISLDGLPKRPEGATRVKISAEMVDVSHLTIVVEDLGFGEIFPATHQIWKKMITV